MRRGHRARLHCISMIIRLLIESLIAHRCCCITTWLRTAAAWKRSADGSRIMSHFRLSQVVRGRRKLCMTSTIDYKGGAALLRVCMCVVSAVCGRSVSVRHAWRTTRSSVHVINFRAANCRLQLDLAGNGNGNTWTKRERAADEQHGAVCVHPRRVRAADNVVDDRRQVS